MNKVPKNMYPTTKHCRIVVETTAKQHAHIVNCHKKKPKKTPSIKALSGILFNELWGNDINSISEKLVVPLFGKGLDFILQCINAIN